MHLNPSVPTAVGLGEYCGIPYRFLRKPTVLKQMNSQIEKIRSNRVKRIRERTESLYRAGFYSADEGKRMMEWTKSELLVECEFILSHAESLLLADRTAVAR